MLSLYKTSKISVHKQRNFYANYASHFGPILNNTYFLFGIVENIGEKGLAIIYYFYKGVIIYYRVFIKYCVFSLKFCDFSELCSCLKSTRVQKIMISALYISRRYHGTDRQSGTTRSCPGTLSLATLRS